MSNDPVARIRNEALEKAAPELAEHAEAIRKLGKRVLSDVIEIGERLSKARPLIAHGHWLRWLEDEFGWSDETARRFMSVFEMNKIHKLWDSELPISALYQLAAPQTSPEVRDDIIERSKKGERLSLADVKETIAKAKVSERSVRVTLKGPNRRTTTATAGSRAPPTSLGSANSSGTNFLRALPYTTRRNAGRL